ncbi:hypothetical protein A3H40_04045 [Candidatus Daviesbacteria bacterium RIFCSPLOWO2_02_FULL_38_15]|uniref:DUF5667 domain-containing protein n=1 Tax=Candidatus Daviesbacteria bacterium RIFCSPLOWO2_02_FULL_38_15 TaxID=1797794 RepID=A0A1F5N446_9BACT|nr:MAG: hypothetical protein A3H40_04045 [Candidatus Daviesbacteria bacterium RIFCSPLOWO2_02_FULL_38_15]
MKYAVKVILLVIIFVFVSNLSLVYGQQDINLPSVSIQPSMTYYPVKRLFEKFMEKLQFTNETKEKYYEDLVQTRLAELKYVVDKDYLDQVEKSTQRVSYQVGVLTDYVVSKKLNDKKQSIADLYKKDKIILEKLRDKYPANSGFWMLIQHIINSIDINLQKF